MKFNYNYNIIMDLNTIEAHFYQNICNLRTLLIIAPKKNTRNKSEGSEAQIVFIYWTM